MLTEKKLGFLCFQSFSSQLNFTGLRSLGELKLYLHFFFFFIWSFSTSLFLQMYTHRSSGSRTCMCREGDTHHRSVLVTLHGSQDSHIWLTAVVHLLHVADSQRTLL